MGSKNLGFFVWFTDKITRGIPVMREVRRDRSCGRILLVLISVCTTVNLAPMYSAFGYYITISSAQTGKMNKE